MERIIDLNVALCFEDLSDEEETIVQVQDRQEIVKNIENFSNLCDLEVLKVEDESAENNLQVMNTNIVNGSNVESINLLDLKVPKVEHECSANIMNELNISEDDDNKSEPLVDENIENFPNVLNVSEDDDNESEPLANEIERRLEVGSLIDNLGNVFLLYCEYARCTGFSVRKSDQRYFGRTQDIRWKEFQCSCTGQPDCKSSTGKVATYQKQITRTNCKARLRVSRVRHGPWKVTLFVKVHNHELVPMDQSYLLRSARHLSHAKKSILEAMHSVGIGVSRACKFMETECRGPENVGFIRKDVYAHMARIKKETKVENGDANALLQYFINKSNNEPFFYWNVQLDDDGRLMNFFFRDSRCAVDFDAFGDVLSIDTTYRTNRYNLICAPFVGINHHKRNVMFGLAFMSDETTNSFKWLFETFLESMNGKAPKIIFSDQCRAMMNAIDQVFPNSCHRLCQWHINQNAPSHFGNLNGNAEFKKLWHQCMNRCDTESNFEKLWHDMIQTYQLSDHRWFSGIYKLRRRWTSVFTNTLFTVGLKATSRSEVTNKVLKDLCMCSGSLYDFVRQYEQIQSNWRYTEGADDTNSIWMPGQLVKNNQLLIHAAKVYTRSVYKSFEFEAAYSLNMAICQHPADYSADILEFTISSCLAGSRMRKISFDKISQESSCSCRMWESEGILCHHILKVYFTMNVTSIPEQYILKRWTKSAKNRNWIQPASGEGEVQSNILPYMTFINEIMRSVHDISVSAKDHRGARDLIRKRLGALRQDLSALLGTTPDDVPDDNVDNNNCHISSRFRDPAKVKERGFSNARVVRHWDASKKKGKRPCGPSIGVDRKRRIKNVNIISPTSSREEIRSKSTYVDVASTSKKHAP